LAIRTREIDAARERDTIVGFLSAHLPGHGGADHFDWLYLANPDGRARVWLAADDEADEAVGVAAAFPRRVRIGGQEILCWNLGDFAIRPEYRSLGPAVILQRACLDAVLDGTVPFAYDHPSCNMMAIYKRLGIPETGRVVRFVKMLRVDEKVGKVLKYSVVASGVSGIGNIVLSIVDRGLLVRRRHGAGALEGRFDDRFDELERKSARGFRVVGVRNQAYLNWRYLDNPLHEHEILTMESGSQLLGYVIIRHEENNATLLDLFAEKVEENTTVVDGLVAGVIETLRGRGVDALNAPLLENNALVPSLKRWGFKARESDPFVVSAPSPGESSETVRDAGNWFLTAGDRDV
jgi:GNAT superfamily N-acetyltransferase